MRPVLHNLNPFAVGFGVALMSLTPGAAALPLILVAHPSFAPSNTKELIAFAKSKPGVNYSSSGHAGTPHLAMLMFAQRTGTQFTHIAYKGGGLKLE